MAAVLLVDQVTKRLVQSNITEGDRDNVFLGVDIVHVRNHGVAFGAFAGGGTIVAVIIGVALVALVVVVHPPHRHAAGVAADRACCSAAPSATSSTASATAR